MKRAFTSAIALAFVVVGAAFAESYTIDSIHTHVQFKTGHMGVSNARGRFNDVTGKLVWDEKDPAKSSIEVEIKTASIDTNNQKRDDHLRGPDFFNAKQFPKITFKSTKVEKRGDRKFEVTGDLTLHGVTKSITVPVNYLGSMKDQTGSVRCGAEAVFTIKRSEFEMKYGVEATGDAVELTVDIEAIQDK